MCLAERTNSSAAPSPGFNPDQCERGTPGPWDGVIADDVTGIGVADDPALIPIGIALAALWLFAASPAFDSEVAAAWDALAGSAKSTVAAGTRLVLLKLNGDRFEVTPSNWPFIWPGFSPWKGWVEYRPASHRGTATTTSAAGKRSGIGNASRKQVMRKLRKRFSEEQVLEIERLLIEAAKKMGEGPSTFLPWVSVTDELPFHLRELWSHLVSRCQLAHEMLADGQEQAGLESLWSTVDHVLGVHVAGLGIDTRVLESPPAPSEPADLAGSIAQIEAALARFDPSAASIEARVAAGRAQTPALLQLLHALQPPASVEDEGPKSNTQLMPCTRTLLVCPRRGALFDDNDRSLGRWANPATRIGSNRN